MLTSRPPGFSDVVARGFCMRVPLRGLIGGPTCATTQKNHPSD